VAKNAPAYMHLQCCSASWTPRLKATAPWYPDQPLRQNVVTGGGNSARGGAQPGKSSSVRPKSQENTFCWSVVGHMYIRPRTCRRVLASASRRQGPRARGGGRGRRAHRSPPPSQPSGRAAAKRLPRAQLRDKTGKHPTLREAAKQ